MRLPRSRRAALALGAGLVAACAQAAAGCTTLTDPQGWSVQVRAPGEYCMGQDLKQAAPWLRLPHQPVPLDPLLAIFQTGNVTVDLAGHRLVATTVPGQGLWHTSGAAWNDGRPHAVPPPYRAITVRNGSIATTVQPAVLMAHVWNGANTRYFMQLRGKDTLRGTPLSDAHGDLARYEATEYVLDHLTLTSDQLVVLMQGKGNIIRHCKIIGGNGAIVLYGPNLVFEDNEIVMQARPAADGADEPAALTVHDGADSVIRNNRFIIRGQADGASAIVLRNSARVVSDGNTVEGKATLLRALDNSTLAEAR